MTKFIILSVLLSFVVVPYSSALLFIASIVFLMASREFQDEDKVYDNASLTCLILGVLWIPVEIFRAVLS